MRKSLARTDAERQQQYVTLLMQAGLPITNATFIQLIDPAFADLASLRAQALTQIALQVEADLDGIQSCIDVFPGENCSTVQPQAMISAIVYPSPTVSPAQAASETLANCAVVYPYMKAFLSPYDLNSSIANISVLADTGNHSAELLLDGNFYNLDPGSVLVNGRDYLTFTSVAQSITVTFSQPFSVTYVRLHASMLAGAASMKVSFPDGQSCPGLYAIANTPGSYATWQTFFCGTLYQDYDFVTNYKAGYITNCGDPQSPQCIAWEQATCPPPAIVWQPGNYYAGCLLNICCYPAVVAPSGYFTGIQITFNYSSVAIPFRVYADELRLQGYAATVLPVPSGLQKYLANYSTACRDEIFWNTLGITNQAAFWPTSQIKSTWYATTCEDNGGWPAIPLDQAQDFTELSEFCLSAPSSSGCWIGAKNRNDFPNASLAMFIDPRCTLHGCYVAQPTLATDVYAVNVSQQAQYIDPPNAASLTSWANLATAWTAAKRYSMVPPSGVDAAFTKALVPVAMNTASQDCTVTFFQGMNCGAGTNCADAASNDGTGIYTFQMQGASQYDAYLMTASVCIDIRGNNPCGPATSYLEEQGPYGTTMVPGQNYYFWNELYSSDTCCIIPSGSSTVDVCTVFSGNPLWTTEAASVGVSGGCQAVVTLMNGATFLLPADPGVTGVGSPIVSFSVGANYVVQQLPGVDASLYFCYELGLSSNNPITKIQLTYAYDVHGFIMDVRAPSTPQSRQMDSQTYPYMCADFVLYEVFTTSGDAVVSAAHPLVWDASMGPVQLGSGFMAALQAQTSSPTTYYANLKAQILPCGLLQCAQCELAQNATFELDPRFLPGADSAFPDLLNQHLEPSLFVNWTNAGGAAQGWTELRSLAATDAVDFAWLSCNQPPYGLHTFYDLDNCVFVNSTGYWTDLCNVSSNVHDYLCNYDILKYQVEAGRQGDACGSNSRSGLLPAAPQQTCFYLFPLANVTANPYKYGIYVQWLAGNLTQVVSGNDTDYDAVYEYLINSSPTSLVLALQSFIACFQAAVSTRAITLNPQGTTPQLNWLDCDLPANFPVTCPGRQCSAETGICRRRCAAQTQVGRAPPRADIHSTARRTPRSTTDRSSPSRRRRPSCSRCRTRPTTRRSRAAGR